MQIPRFYEHFTYLLTNRDPVLGLYGPREAGKTTILKNFLSKTSKKYRFNSGENPRIQEMFATLDPEKIRSYTEGFDLIVIDEASYIPNFKESLRIMVEQHHTLNIIFTGSSIIDVGGIGGSYYLLPISQMELVYLYDGYELRERLPEYLLFGGYPEVIVAPTKTRKIHILERILKNSMLKDILALENLKKSESLLDLMRLIAFHVGKEISFYDISQQLGIDYKTVERYLSMLEKSFIIISLHGYNSYTQKDILKKTKYYFYDNGILNTLMGDFSDLDIRNDIDMLWKNFIFMERYKSCLYHDLYFHRYFWKTWGKHQIDLVEEWAEKYHGYEFIWDKSDSKQEKQWYKANPNSTFLVINRYNYLDFCTQPNKDLMTYQDKVVVQKSKLLSKLVFPQIPPNDPFYKYLWNLDDDGKTYGSGKGKVVSRYGIQAWKAWKEGVSGKGVIVAILSTGIAYEDYFDPVTNHYNKKAPDFEKTHFLSSLAKDFSVHPPDNHANDWFGVGTLECHIVAATINNHFGGCGIAFGASILPIAIELGSLRQYKMTEEIFIDAIKYAADCGAKVIMSQLYFCEKNSNHRNALHAGKKRSLHEAVKYATKKGSLIVTSSCHTGKYGLPMGTIVYPGGFSETLAVGCTRFDGTLTSYSNFADYISVYAPSSDNIDLNKDGIPDGIYVETFNPFPLENGVYSFNQDFFYQFRETPANAIAEVAAVAALVFERHPDWTPNQVKTAIEKSAKPFTFPHKGKFHQYGILDAYGAVTYEP